MKILQWNCCNGLGTNAQIEYFKSFSPDIAVLPELKEKNIEALQPSSYFWVTNNHKNSSPKGLGVLAFNGIQLQPLPRDEDMEIYLPIEVSAGDFRFKLLAVWNFYWACKQGRFKGVKGDYALEWSVLDYYSEFLKDPALMIGDWNFGPTFSQLAFLKLCEFSQELGLRSLYHKFYGLSLVESKHPTFKTTRNQYHHLDHIFASDYFINSTVDLSVGNFKDVVLSDHTPISLEIRDN